MSAAPEQRAWQRARPSSTNRTPASRSSTASPNPSSGSQGAKTPSSGAVPGNVWAERSKTAAQRSSSAAANVNREGSAAREEAGSGNASASAGGRPGSAQHAPVNGFNGAEVKEFLSRGGKGTVHKPNDGAGKTGGAWGTKANHMANGQPFFVTLSKQVSSLRAPKGG